MNARTTWLAIALAATLLHARSWAQDQVDIRLVKEEGRVRIELIPSTTEEGVISCVVFTLRWPTGTIQHLGAPEGTAALPLPIQESGPVHEHGPYSYQIYAGFGMVPLSALGMSWAGGESHTLVSIPVIGSGTVELVNDAWTQALMNNGDFFVSIGGEDRTGEILTDVVITALAEGSSSSTGIIAPNPNDGHFNVHLPITGLADRRITLMDATGRVVLHEQLGASHVAKPYAVDISHHPAGAYTLLVETAGNREVHRVVVR